MFNMARARHHLFKLGPHHYRRCSNVVYSLQANPCRLIWHFDANFGVKISMYIYNNKIACVFTSRNNDRDPTQEVGV